MFETTATPDPLSHTLSQLSLAQLGDLFQPQIPPLPSAPLIERWLFEAPLMPTLILGGLGIVLLVGLATRGKTKPGALAFFAMVMLAVGVQVVSRQVETGREAIAARTAALIGATAAADTATLGPMLHDSARVVAFRASVDGGRDAILQAVQRQLGQNYRVAEHNILKTTAVIDGANTARSQVLVGVKPAQSGTGMRTWWEITWRAPNTDPETDDWQATEIELLHLPVPGYTYSDK